MDEPTFHQVLEEAATSRLTELGFQYDESLEDREITYGYRKHLGEDLYASIEFQRHQYEEVPYGYGFTVYLSRHRLDSSGHRRFRRTEGDFATRLGSIIVNAYGLWLYRFWDHWWDAATSEQLKTELNDALQRLERYGIPALEDPDYRDMLPSGHRDEWNTFQATLDNVVLGELYELGYESKDDPHETPPLPRRIRRYFVKRLGSSHYGFIGFEPFKCLHRPDVNPQSLPLRHFGVLIARKRSDNPHAEINLADAETFQGWVRAIVF